MKAMMKISVMLRLFSAITKVYIYTYMSVCMSLFVASVGFPKHVLIKFFILYSWDVIGSNSSRGEGCGVGDAKFSEDEPFCNNEGGRNREGDNLSGEKKSKERKHQPSSKPEGSLLKHYHNEKVSNLT